MMTGSRFLLTSLMIVGFILGFHNSTAHANNPLAQMKAGLNSTTQIRVMTPFSAEGINSKLKITEKTEGLCWTSSQANKSRPNTWRCHANDTVYDPCFKSSIHDQNHVICLKNPWDNRAVLLKLSAPLPSVKTAKFSRLKSQPWALDLGHGRQCVLVTGPNASIAGMEVKYQCTSGALVLGDIDRSSNQWLVFYLGNEDLFMHQTEVVTAWY